MWLEDPLVASTRDDRQSLSHGSAQADAVIEMVMRLDDLCHAFARHERVHHVEDRLKCGIRTIGLDHGDVVVELEEGVAVHANPTPFTSWPTGSAVASFTVMPILMPTTSRLEARSA